jgi:pimeloyl-ACP methyl ester carboxylesterase
MTIHSSANRVSHFAIAPDGLRLHYLEYGSRLDPGAPVVCLPGLARTAEDFDRLAHVLAVPANGQKRRILALDYRGRGRSAWDPDWTHYNLNTEHEDILATLAAAEVTNAIFIGTSRGGLHVMVLAAVRPSLIRGAVINDIGPVIERAGLMRIKNYVGKLPPSASWKDAVDHLRKSAGAHFTNVAEVDWEIFARLTFTEDNGQFRLRYDPALARTFETISADSPLPDLWPQFEALANVPVLGIRGNNSDLLSPATFTDMGKRHPAFEMHVVKGQGHAPLLLDIPTISVIVDFIARCP